MARYFTMPYGLGGVFEGGVYRGTPLDAATFGVERLRDRDTNAESHFHTLSGLWVGEGWRFGRRMTAQSELTGEPSTFEPWQPLHAQGEPEREWSKLLVKVDFEVKAAPGVPMKDPDGFLIWLNGGTEAQPASGEQARDPWTGELLWLDPPENTMPQLEP